MSRLWPALCRRVIPIAIVLAVAASAAAVAAVDYPAPADQDRDGVVDDADACSSVAGDLQNGCPSEINADVRGRWRVNALLSQLMSLTVRAPLGSRISMRCEGRRGACDFSTRFITRTTKRTTSLTRYFKGRRILPARVAITVRVTRREQIGLYERVVTRIGRRLPSVTHRCLSATGRVQRCAADT